MHPQESRGGEVRKRGKDVFSADIVLLYREGLNVSPIIKAIRENRKSDARMELSRLRAGFQPQEGPEYAAGDNDSVGSNEREKIINAKTFFDGLAARMIKEGMGEQRYKSVLETIDSAIQFIDEQPDDINVESFNILLEQNGIK